MQTLSASKKFKLRHHKPAKRFLPSAFLPYMGSLVDSIVINYQLEELLKVSGCLQALCDIGNCCLRPLLFVSFGNTHTTSARKYCLNFQDACKHCVTLTLLCHLATFSHRNHNQLQSSTSVLCYQSIRDSHKKVANVQLKIDILYDE